MVLLVMARVRLYAYAWLNFPFALCSLKVCFELYLVHFYLYFNGGWSKDLFRKYLNACIQKKCVLVLHFLVIKAPACMLQFYLNFLIERRYLCAKVFRFIALVWHILLYLKPQIEIVVKIKNSFSNSRHDFIYIYAFFIITKESKF